MSDRTYYVVVDKDGCGTPYNIHEATSYVLTSDILYKDDAPHKVIECIPKSEYDALKAELERLSQYIGFKQKVNSKTGDKSTTDSDDFIHPDHLDAV